MELRYQLTCNPWSDRGAVILADLLDHSGLVIQPVHVTSGEIVVRFHQDATREQIAQFLAERLRQRQNGMIVPNSLARALTALKRDVSKTDADGYKTTDLMVNVGAKDLPELKKRNINTVKAGDNKIYRLTASYPGMPGDLRNMFDKADTLGEQVVDEMTGPPTGRFGSCSVGGGATQHLEALTQSLHIFANKHHNASVRGFGGGNGYFKVGATWRYALALSATEPYHPFFETRDDGTTLLLPIVDDLVLLRGLHRHFKFRDGLADITDPAWSRSSTNIQGLYHNDPYSGLVSLFHCLRNPLAAKELVDDGLDPQELPRLTRWITGRFKRATYVSFGTFHTIDVNHHLFDYVQPLNYKQSDRQYLLVRDVVNRMQWPANGAAELFSRALVESSISTMKVALWTFYKDHDSFAFYRGSKDQPSVLSLLNAFIAHFVGKEDRLEPELLNAAKHIGKVVGRAFPRDITLLSRIYNIHDAAEMREALKMVLFRLEKAGVDQAKRDNVQDNERLFPISNKSFEVLLEGLREDNLRELADVFSIFASLNAFNANVGSKEERTDDTPVADTSELISA